LETPMTRKDALKLGAVAGVAFSAAGLLPRVASAASVGAGSKPSVLLIVVDDMPDRLLQNMTAVKNRLIAPGTRFLNAYTAIPLCGPNRAAILSGMFPHTTQVDTNAAWKAFSAGGHEAFTFVKALKDAGYDTALCGKYMNGRNRTAMQTRPVGWDYWFETQGAHDLGTGFTASDNGTLLDFGPNANESLLSFQKARDWIASRQPATQPFFIQWSPTNPHIPYAPTAAHAHDYDNEPPRKAPSVNESDMTDKPDKLPRRKVDPAKLSEAEEGMREELEDTDDWVAQLITAAEQVTGNSNLLVIFTSDNGFQAGEHRVMHKGWPYQESVEIPLIMRATGLPAQRSTQLVSSVDISWTILEFAGVATPRALDGRSLHEIVLGIQPASWRKRVVIEGPADMFWQMYREFQPAAGKDFAFIKHLDDPTPEFYNLTVDEYQLASKPGKVTADMRSKLNRLTSLEGANLRAVEEEA
jgi:N-acetylglucosamine-6-sulfatase